MKLLTEKDTLYHCFKSQKREGKSRISKRLGTHRGIGDTIKCFLLLLERHPVRPCSCSLLELRLAFTAVTRVQIPPGTPNLIRSLRAIAHFLVSTKRNTFRRNLRCRFPGTLVCRGYFNFS